jgi:hypothetical protein
MVIPALKSLRHKNQEFQASLCYISPVSKSQNNKIILSPLKKSDFRAEAVAQW